MVIDGHSISVAHFGSREDCSGPFQPAQLVAHFGSIDGYTITFGNTLANIKTCLLVLSTSAFYCGLGQFTLAYNTVLSWVYHVQTE